VLLIPRLERLVGRSANDHPKGYVSRRRLVCRSGEGGLAEDSYAEAGRLLNRRAGYSAP